MELSAAQVHGHLFEIKKTDPRHIGASLNEGALSEAKSSGFGGMLLDALASVNQDQQKAMTLNELMVTNPDAVDVHDVTIGLAEANMSLSITKAVVDRALRAYNELMNMR